MKKRSTKQIAQLIANAAHEIQAMDLLVLNLQKLTSFTDYFVICSGRSLPQMQSIANAATESLKKNGLKIFGIEGYDKGQWILVDSGDVVFHIFHEEVREYYALEKLWADATREKM